MTLGVFLAAFRGGGTALPCISTSLPQRLTHPSLPFTETFRCKKRLLLPITLQLFPPSRFFLFQLISRQTWAFKGDLSGGSGATSSSPGAAGEVARQQFSLPGSVMLYAMIYKAQKEPAAVKYISFSFPSCPALLKPPLYANVTEDANGRHQGHELAGRMGRKMGLREEKERTRESSQGT